MNLKKSLGLVKRVFRRSADTNQTYEALRRWRNRLAEERKIKPYVIFTNRNLRELAKRNPRTVEEMGNLEGVGAKRLSLYAPEVLKVLAASRSERAG